MKAHNFELILVDPVEELCTQFQTYFGQFERVSIHHGRFEELPDFDCMVSAANSFGLMDGGVDLAITSFFGVELMDRVQQRVVVEYRGEQPVGTCMIVETNHEKHPFIAHSPTMRVPMQIAATDHAYVAMWAMLSAVWRHNQLGDRQIRKVACPGLGTACGAMDIRVAAKQMSLAYYNFLHPPEMISWPYAANRQTAIGRGRGGDLQSP